MSNHKDYKFSVTVHTDDLAVLYSLRGLTMYCQATGNPRIPWGGTKRSDWQRDSHCVTFHFSSKIYRESFSKEAVRLFPANLWKQIREDDNDPATPQNES
jgi:hypothetical protein